MSLASIDRCVDGGLIEVDWDRSKEDRSFRDHDLRYKLTEAGASSAAALDVTLDRALAAPKKKPPKPEMTREEKEAAKRLRYARKDLAYLANGGRLVKTDRFGWICRSMDSPYEPPGRNSWYLSVDRNLPLFRHLTEEFVGVDGLPSLRINAAGAEIIAKRRSLTCA